MNKKKFKSGTKTAKSIESKIRKALYDFKLLENQKKICIALSGGKDSLTLLHMLANITGRGFPMLDIIAIHVGGAFSCGAEINKSFLQKICDELNVKLILKNDDTTLQGLDCYKCARNRRKIIFNEAKKLNIETIAFGHTKDDLNQTLLMNLFHKGEFSTMLPKIKMIKYGISIIRPLLFVNEKETTTYAKQNEFLKTRCNCPNSSISYRKKTQDLIKHIEKTFPSVENNLSTASFKYGSHKAEKC